MAGWEDINVYDYRLGNLDSYAVLINSALHLTAEKRNEQGHMLSYRFHLYDISGSILERFDITDDAENFRYFRDGVRYAVLDHMVGYISKLYRLEKDNNRNILVHLFLKQYPTAEKITSAIPNEISINATKACVKCPDGMVIGVERKKEATGFRFVLFSQHGDVIQDGDVGDTADEQSEYTVREAIAITADRAGYTEEDCFVKVAVEKYLDEYDYQQYRDQCIKKKASHSAR